MSEGSRVVVTEKVLFNNKQGIELTGEIDVAEAGNNDAVVLVHGLGGSKASHVVVKLGEALSSKGIHCLRVDLSGNGTSQGVWEYTPYLSHCDDDVVAAVEFLKNVKGFRVIGVLGHSMGGNIVMMYASRHYGIVPAVVNVSGRYFMNHGNSKHFKEEQIAELEATGKFVWRVDKVNGKELVVTQEAIDRRAALDMVEYMNQLIAKAEQDDVKEANSGSVKCRTRILTIHGALDQIIPVEDARAYHAQLSGSAKVGSQLSSLVVVDSADHYYSKKEEYDPLTQAAADFLQQIQSSS